MTDLSNYPCKCGHAAKEVIHAKKKFGAVGTVITAKDLQQPSAEKGEWIGRIMLVLYFPAVVLAVEVILSNLQ